MYMPGRLRTASTPLEDLDALGVVGVGVGRCFRGGLPLSRYREFQPDVTRADVRARVSRGRKLPKLSSTPRRTLAGGF